MVPEHLREAHNLRGQAYYRANLEQRRAYNREWQKAHKDEIRERRKIRLEAKERERLERMKSAPQQSPILQITHNVVVQF